MRVRIIRRTHPWLMSRHATVDLLRRREFHVHRIGPWIVYWWGRDHWSEDL